MKAFTFRLEQTLRWRENQASLQKARLSAATANAAKAEAALDFCRSEGRNAAASVRRSTDGAALAAFARFTARSQARIRELEKKTRQAQAARIAEMDRLVEARRGVRVLEKIRETEQDRWRRAFDREIETFAAEAFLQRFQRKR
jgi:flagellar export protein FliJ